MTFRILFQLRDLAHVVPWGAPPNLSLSWFGLTDGAYCIDTPAGRLLDFHGKPTAGLSVTWCDYQIARLFEDMIDAFPTIMEPVPADVIDRFHQWQANPASQIIPEDDQLADRWYRAQEWLGWRQIDFGYLVSCPKLHLWRTGDEVHGRWRLDPKNAASAQLTIREADFSLPVDDFDESANTFFRVFLGQMRERVTQIARDGWPGKPCRLDVALLVAEQDEREAEPQNRAGLKRVADWDEVRRDLRFLGA